MLIIEGHRVDEEADLERSYNGGRPGSEREGNEGYVYLRAIERAEDSGIHSCWWMILTFKVLPSVSRQHSLLCHPHKQISISQGADTVFIPRRTEEQGCDHLAGITTT